MMDVAGRGRRVIGSASASEREGSDERLLVVIDDRETLPPAAADPRLVHDRRHSWAGHEDQEVPPKRARRRFTRTSSGESVELPRGREGTRPTHDNLHNGLIRICGGGSAG